MKAHRNSRLRIAVCIGVVASLMIGSYFYYRWKTGPAFDATKIDSMKIFESRTESEPTGYGKPDPALIKVLRNESTEAEEGLDYCSKEKKLAAEDILLVHPVAERDGKTLYFVRPTLAPYCGPFYGAHSFHFWFVEKSKSSGAPKYTVVLEWRSDRAVVLKNIHNGRNDVLTEYCVAAGCDGEIRTYCPVLGKYIESQAYHVKSDMPD